MSSVPSQSFNFFKAMYHERSRIPLAMHSELRCSWPCLVKVLNNSHDRQSSMRVETVGLFLHRLLVCYYSSELISLSHPSCPERTQRLLVLQDVRSFYSLGALASKEISFPLLQVRRYGPPTPGRAQGRRHLEDRSWRLQEQGQRRLFQDEAG